MRLYREMLYRGAACLIGAATLLLASCEKSEEIIDSYPPLNDEQCMLLPPSISVEPFGGGSVFTRAASAIKEESQQFNVGEELGNIITLGNSKTDETPQTRTLNTGAYCRIVVYKLEDWNNNTLKVHEQRLCKQGSTAYFADHGDVTTPIYLNYGSYKIFCYSFNKTTTDKMGKLADGAANVPLSDGDDFMSIVKDLTITGAQLGTDVSLGTVTLEHRCCQLIGILTAAEGFTGIDASPAPSLSATSTFTTAGNWPIKGNSFAATATASQTKAFTMAKSGNDYKGTMVILPLTEQALQATYNFTPSGGKNINTSDKSIATSTSFSSGGSYTFTIKALGSYVITDGVESVKIGDYTWATRNVRYDNQFETNLNIWESGNIRGASQGTSSEATTNSEFNSYISWGMKTPSTGKSFDSGSSWSNNPCPSGYKVPTSDQFTNLITKKIPYGKKVKINGEVHTIGNYGGFYNGNSARGLVLLDGVNVLFLPAAGYRYGSDWRYVSSYGRYWSSTPNESQFAYHLDIREGSCRIDLVSRAYGYSVRCVKG